MPSLEEMASKGAEKLTRKADIMARNYDAAKSRMKAHYGAVGFGPTRTSNYNAAIDAARYRIPDVNKWRENWLDAMRQ